VSLVGLRIDRAAFAKAIGVPRERISNPGPMLKAAVPLIRDSAAREFLSQSWFAPNGAVRPWTPTQPFGDRLGGGDSKGPGKGTKKTMIDSGGLFEAIQGTGPGSVVVITANRVSVGVDLSAFPYAPILRGGVGADIDLSPAVIRPTKKVAGAGGSFVRQWAMFWFLGLTFGVWLSEAKLREGIVLPRRPYLTANPALTKRLAAMAERYLLQGRIG
jgi:hypothetical protein